MFGMGLFPMKPISSEPAGKLQGSSHFGPLTLATKSALAFVPGGIICIFIYVPGTHLSFVLPLKEGLFQSKQGTFGFQVCILKVDVKPHVVSASNHLGQKDNNASSNGQLVLVVQGPLLEQCIEGGKSSFFEMGRAVQYNVKLGHVSSRYGMRVGRQAGRYIWMDACA